MADNVNVTAGTGTVIATDQVGTDHYQRIKLTDGTADSSTPINVDIGAKANALRVAPANDITDATYIGDIKFGEALPANTNTQEVVGDAANNAAVAGNPLAMGGLYDSTKPTVLDDGDVGYILVDSYGRPLAGVEPQRFQATITSADAQSATQVKAKTASLKMYILSLIASTDTALNLQFQDDTGPTVLIEGIYLAANGGFVMNFPPQAPLVVNTNEDFDVIASAAGNISVTITGYLAP